LALIGNFLIGTVYSLYFAMCSFVVIAEIAIRFQSNYLTFAYFKFSGLILLMSVLVIIFYWCFESSVKHE